MNLVFPRLYAIIDPTLLTISELELAEALAGSGVELIQYRNKTASSRQFFEISRQLSRFLRPRGVRLKFKAANVGRLNLKHNPISKRRD